jgi:hypothetical protein
MVFVMEALFGSCSDDCVAKGAAHRVRAYNEPTTLPTRTTHIPFRSADLIKSSNDQGLGSFAFGYLDCTYQTKTDPPDFFRLGGC